MTRDEQLLALLERYVVANEAIAECQIRQTALAERAEVMNQAYLEEKRREVDATTAGMAAVALDCSRKGNLE